MKKVCLLGYALVASAGIANAGVWSVDNTADVGNMLNTASVTDGFGSLEKIQGRLVATFSGTVSWDQDIYCIHINDGAAFSAVAYPTPGSASGPADMNLALFDAAGHGIAFNDNSGGFAYPALTNLFTTGLAAGDYYLAVSRNSSGGNPSRFRGNRPLAGGVLMFPGQVNNSLSTDPSAPLRDGEFSNLGAVFSGWEAVPFSFPLNDFYDIDFGCGYCVPAPAGMGLLTLGLLGVSRRRR